jgi:hypothetical protein
MGGDRGIPSDFTSAYKARPAGSEPRKRRKQQNLLYSKRKLDYFSRGNTVHEAIYTT